MRRLLILLFVPIVVVFMAVPASASSPHFKRNGEPSCTISGSDSSKSTTCTASLAGLGNGTLVIDVTVAGSAVYLCQNNGGQTAAGQNKVLVGPATTPTTIDADQIKNGTVTFTTDPAVLTAPTTVTGAQAGCPNANWTGVNPVLTLTSITMDITQGGVLLFHCTATDPNGLSGTVTLTC